VREFLILNSEFLISAPTRSCRFRDGRVPHAVIVLPDPTTINAELAEHADMQTLRFLRFLRLPS